MDFTEEKIKRLRTFLLLYKEQKARNGQGLSWEIMTSLILDCRKTINQHDGGGNSNFKKEALRRFAMGISVLTWDKLQDVKTFLVHEKFITESDLNRGLVSIENILSTYNCLGIDSEDARAHMSRFCGHYQAVLGELSSQYCFNLYINPDSSGTFFKVKEQIIHNFHPDFSGDETLKDTKYCSKASRNGFGFVSTSKKSIHLFLQGKLSEDRVTYYESTSVGSNADILKRVFFVRIGEFCKWDIFLKPDIDGMPCYKFENVSSVVCEEH